MSVCRAVCIVVRVALFYFTMERLVMIESCEMIDIMSCHVPISSARRGSAYGCYHDDSMRYEYKNE